MALRTSPGPREAAVREMYDSERELYGGIPVAGWEEAQDLLKETKETFLAKLAQYLDDRIPCHDEIDSARIALFDFKAIPVGNESATVAARATHGTALVQKFVEHFAHYWMDRGFSLAEAKQLVINEYGQIKSRYAATVAWHSRSNKELRTLVYQMKEDYPHYHLLIQIDAALPDDQSCCERWVSKLNAIKTKSRSRLSNTVANDLMTISQNGPPPDKVDWLAVLDIWREDSTRGRYNGKWKSDNLRVANALDRSE